ncbi:MAG: quinone oxidoreductase-like protein 1, partial [Candidatus Limnocylindrus sp.]
MSFLRLEPQPEMVRMGQNDNELVRVRAVGLNFRDVLNALGEYPGDPGPPGGDMAGSVVEVSRASDHSTDDGVFGVAHASLASIARASTQLLSLKPATLTFEESSTLPVAWSTGHSVCEHARPGAGESVIIHALAGGVGLKALEYVLWMNGLVMGSAGVPHKHVQLRSMGGVWVCSSRNGGAFGMGTSRLMDGCRTSMCVNSLGADFLVASLASIREGGTFEEIGKRAAW